MAWANPEKSTVSSRVSLPEKEIQTTLSSLLCTRRSTIYDLRVPTTTLNFTITFYRKSYNFLVKRSQLSSALTSKFQDSPNSIISPRENQCIGAPTYTITHWNKNVNGRKN